MLLQRGRFLINDISELNNLSEDKDGLKRIIDLSYMGKFEFEGNSIPVSRMFIEYFKEDYEFYHFNMFDKNGKQMIIYANKRFFNNLNKIDKYLYDREYSFYDYVNYPNREYNCNFWWNIEGDYIIFFGEEKKDLINYFINGCYKRDGGKELIKEKINKCGYKCDYN